MTGGAPAALRPARLAWLLGLVAAGALLGTEFVALPWSIAGDSMLPTLVPGDRILVDLWTYRHRKPRVGEIVLFRGPAPAGTPLVKRVGRAPAPPGGRPRPGEWGELENPRDSGPGLWMLGDNRAGSRDSRHFGAVPRSRVTGRAVWRYWPPSRMGRIR